ncbi:MAG: phosphotransferase, partial [Anaerolineae bacterium]|nr:phosphotransferase [Anaerolineae bacterium]
MLGEPIAYGRTAEIHALSDNRILKLCYDWVSEGAVRYEARIARAVHDAGLPVPAVGEVREVDGRFGVVYERVEGLSMFRVLAAKPWQLPRHARTLAVLHAQMHGIAAIAGLPAQRQRLQDKI